MKVNLAKKAHIERHFSRIDLIHNHLSCSRQDFFRLLISKFGELNFAPVSLIDSLNGMSYALSCFDVTDYVGALTKEVDFLIEEINEIEFIGDLPKFSLRKKRKAWIKWQLFEFLQLVKKANDEDNVRFAGAYLYCVLDEVKVNRQLPTILFKLFEKGYDQLSAQEVRALYRLELIAKKHLSGLNEKQKLTFEKRVRFYFLQKIQYASAKARQSVLDRNTYSASEFEQNCLKLKSAVLAKNQFEPAVVNLLALFTNLPVSYVLEIPIFENVTEEWVIALSLNEGLIYFDLSVLFPGGQDAVGESFIKSSQVLVKPLPKFLAETIQSIASESTCNETIRDLLGDATAFEGINPTKLANTYARFATQHADLYMAGLIANDFRNFPTSKIYYSQSSRTDIWQASSTVFNALGLGEPVTFVDGLSVGSSAVLTDAAVSQLFAILAYTVEQTKPSNNSNVEELLQFHEIFTAYTATLAIFCLALRDANPLKIFADDVLSNQPFVIINDKNVHGLASAQPVTVCKVLQEQYLLYLSHSNSLLTRLKKKSAHKFSIFTSKLESIVGRQHVLALITYASQEGLSSQDVADFWPVNVPINFGRHFWASNFKALGLTDRQISAHLRHQVASNLNWSADSNFVLSALIEKIDEAQTIKLQQLGIQALSGLSRKLQ